jgi:hypothetical protein
MAPEGDTLEYFRSVSWAGRRRFSLAPWRRVDTGEISCWHLPDGCSTSARGQLVNVNQTIAEQQDGLTLILVM